MKGVVFTQFLEFVEESYSADVVDDIIDAADVSSGGVYTTVGTYDHQELQSLVVALSENSGTRASDLVHAFGRHLFKKLAAGFPHFLAGSNSTFEFLRSVDNYIHVEVLKLYPDAELPKFEYESPSPNQLIIIYSSKRSLQDLAHGMMEQASVHFGEEVDIQREDLASSEGSVVRFVLTLKE